MQTTKLTQAEIDRIKEANDLLWRFEDNYTAPTEKELRYATPNESN